MKNNWQKIKVRDSEYFSISLGGTPTTGVAEYWNGNILWVTPTDLSRINDSIIDKTERMITESGLKNSSAKLLPKGSIVISTRAPIGYLAIADKELTINQGCKALVIKNINEIDNRFVYYQLLSKVKLIKSLGTGSTFLELSKTELGSIEILLPSKPTQQKIVKVLDGIRAEIGKQKKIIETTKELKKSLMKKMFSEEVRGEKEELGKICFLRKEQRLSNGNDAYVGLEHIDSGDNKIKRFGSGSDVVSLKNKFYKNDILYGKLRPYLDKVVIADREGVCSTDILVIQCNDNRVIPQYLIYLLHMDEFLYYVKGNTSGTNHPRVSWNVMKDYRINLPEIIKQKEIASTFQKVDERIELAQKQKKIYEELFNITLKKIMNGEIDVDRINI